jgi:hypothetical protein
MEACGSDYGKESGLINLYVAKEHGYSMLIQTAWPKDKWSHLRRISGRRMDHGI